MQYSSVLSLFWSCTLLVANVVFWSLEQYDAMRIALILMFSAFAIYLQTRESLKTFAFTAWVLAFVAAGVAYPEAFMKWGDLELKTLIVPLIQVIMFGMGTTLSIKDFARVAMMPKAVAIGMLLQFSVMPLAGLAIATGFGFEAGVAAGVVLIGSCPGGVASNVMTFLSRGNVALSVTMTACSTLVSPIMTPLLMQFLAGELINIDVGKMMLSIVKMVIFPIVAGLIVNWILQKSKLTGKWLERIFSFVAMASICFIIGIIVAHSADDLLTVGAAVFCAAILHNGIGYVLGYWGARLIGLDESSRRTVAIEVGLQNGGMATGLAVNVLNNASAAIAPAIFGPWMNVSGSILASWWRRRPVNPNNEVKSIP